LAVQEIRFTVPTGATFKSVDKVETDKLDPASGTALEIGTSGDTITVPSGATFNVAGTMQSGGVVVANTPFIFVRNSATQAIATGTATKVTFDTEIVDSDGEFASDKWTCVTAGRYFFNVALEMQSMTDAKENWLKIYKNGIAMIPTFTQFSGAGGYSNVASIMINVDASDYFEIYVLQNNGNNRNVSAEGCVWSIIRIIE